MSESEDPASAGLAELSNILLGERSVDDLLDIMVGMATTAVESADSVSLSLGELGRLTTNHSTDDLARELDGVQYRDGVGPCVDAVREARQVNLSIEGDDRYPHFSNLAGERFITSVLSTPLIAGERVLGAMNCYSASVDEFGPPDVRAAKQFASHAAVVLANASTLEALATTNDQLRQALVSRDLIGQAKGILMERFGYSADEAFDQLRRTSQHENRKLTAVARDLIDREPPDAG